MTGAFYYYSGEYPDEQWGTLAVIAGLIGGGVQTGSLVIATFYVDKVLRCAASGERRAASGER
eukprot:scaffold79_cov259-Pinguiococcus_pyrenoidosus.AAC.45